MKLNKKQFESYVQKLTKKIVNEAKLKSDEIKYNIFKGFDWDVHFECRLDQDVAKKCESLIKKHNGKIGMKSRQESRNSFLYYVDFKLESDAEAFYKELKNKKITTWLQPVENHDGETIHF